MEKKRTPISSREKHMKEGRRWLGCLRRKEYPYDLYMQFIHEEIKAGCFMLEDIGTSEAELEELCKEGSKRAAKVWLNHIRKDPNHPRCAHFLAGEIKKGGLTHDDLGITKEELFLLAPIAAAMITSQ